jgi:hypothetical protein
MIYVTQHQSMVEKYQDPELRDDAPKVYRSMPDVFTELLKIQAKFEQNEQPFYDIKEVNATLKRTIAVERKIQQPTNDDKVEDLKPSAKSTNRATKPTGETVKPADKTMKPLTNATVLNPIALDEPITPSAFAIDLPTDDEWKKYKKFESRLPTTLQIESFAELIRKFGFKNVDIKEIEDEPRAVVIAFAIYMIAMVASTTYQHSKGIDVYTIKERDVAMYDTAYLAISHHLTAFGPKTEGKKTRPMEFKNGLVSALSIITGAIVGLTTNTFIDRLQPRQDDRRCHTKGDRWTKVEMSSERNTTLVTELPGNEEVEGGRRNSTGGFR